MKGKKENRTRLSIDLDAYPDVKEMLADAEKATGESTTRLVVLALREQLPAIVREIHEQRSEGTKKFLSKYLR